MSPYSPARRPASFRPLIAELTKTLSPQTTGLERPRPGMSVFHNTFVLAATFHSVGAGPLSEIPLADTPRNCGQSIPGRGALPAAARPAYGMNAAPTAAHATTKP